MNCSHCTTQNEDDAAYCSECGKPLAPKTDAGRNQRRTYWFAVLLLPVVALAVGVGYYKFFLPDGIAAVVNNETITLSELDQEMSRIPGIEQSQPGQARYQILNQMITRRIALQEAQKSDVRISADEAKAAWNEARASSGMDEAAFDREVAARYGNARNFQTELEQNLLIRKFLHEKIIPAGASPDIATREVNKWLAAASLRASVRIALAEQSGGCSDCAMQNHTMQKKGGCGSRGCGGQHVQGPAGQSTASSQVSAACLAYWKSKHGDDTVTAAVRDFGCHQQVEIIRNNKIVGTLRYQNGSITELTL